MTLMAKEKKEARLSRGGGGGGGGGEGRRRVISDQLIRQEVSCQNQGAMGHGSPGPLMVM